MNEKAYKFGKVGVLMGGLSLEREISLLTGENIYNALIKKGVNAVKIEWNEHNDIIEQIKFFNPDVIFIAIHGKGGEDGYIQGILNTLKIPYTGSGEKASAISMDKILSKNVLIKNGIKTPDYILMPSLYDADEVINKLGLPLIVKPIADGSSNGISIVHCKEELHQAWEKANQCNSGVFAEKVIEGSEITVGFIEGQVLPSIRIESAGEIYDFESKYYVETAKYISPAVKSKDLEEKIQNICHAASKAIGHRGWGRIDTILDQNEDLYLFDINTIPGCTKTSLVLKAIAFAGLSFEDIILKVLSLAKCD